LVAGQGNAAECASLAVGGNMRKYDDVVAVARICMIQSTRTDNPVVAEELRLIAKGYQMRAAAMSGGVVPYIGEDVTESACSDHAAD
jgi:hypothetical protein